MNIQFTKYHGAGNDFIMIDSRKNDMPDRSVATIARLCDRHFGIGADGLIILDESEEHDFRMTYYNADGRLGTMCGNGGRCATAFARAQGWIDRTTTFEAADGLHRAAVIDDIRVELSLNNVQGIEEINLHENAPGPDGSQSPQSSPTDPGHAGSQSFEPTDPGYAAQPIDSTTPDSKAPGSSPTDPDTSRSESGAALSGGTTGAEQSPAQPFEPIACLLDTGSPHLVVFAPDVEALDVHGLGSRLRHNPRFAPGVNVNFVQRTEEGIRVRTFERGVEAETLSCGTGVTAAAIASSLRWPHIDPPVTVYTRGGTLEVKFKMPSQLPDGKNFAATVTPAAQSDGATGITSISLTGPATPVFDGILTYS